MEKKYPADRFRGKKNSYSEIPSEKKKNLTLNKQSFMAKNAGRKS